MTATPTKSSNDEANVGPEDLKHAIFDLLAYHPEIGQEELYQLATHVVDELESLIIQAALLELWRHKRIRIDVHDGEVRFHPVGAVSS